ncbi:alpha-hydroxy acid oxidase [Corynebacterium sp. 335C]
MSTDHRPRPDVLRRRIPRYSDLRPLMRFAPPPLTAAERLRRAADVHDLRKMAKRRTPKAPFDYVDGAAESEVSIGRARDAFRDVEFRPEVMRDVTTASTAVRVLGRDMAMPLAIAPTGFTRMMHSEGEYAGASAAAAAGVPFTLSTMGTASIGQLRDHVPEGELWFQLYVTRDRSMAEDLVAQAKASGAGVLMVTVDTNIAGARLRDVRNGMTVPPSLTARTVVDAAYRPNWWFNFLTHAPLEFAAVRNFDGTPGELVDQMFDPSLSWADLEWVRGLWDGPLLVKGVQTVVDARRAMEHGADGVIVSNHGGRQLDRAPVPLHLLPRVRAALGPDAVVGLDTGIMHGADVAAARALGADFAMIGRAYLYGLMAGGEAGVARALELMREEMLRTCRLLGVADVADLGPRHVRLPGVHDGAPEGAEVSEGAEPAE